MEVEAQKQGLNIDKSRLAKLQPLAGRNPILARKIIKNEALGLKQLGNVRGARKRLGQ
jgi:hypothetical protein